MSDNTYDIFGGASLSLSYRGAYGYGTDFAVGPSGGLMVASIGRSGEACFTAALYTAATDSWQTWNRATNMWDDLPSANMRCENNGAPVSDILTQSFYPKVTHIGNGVYITTYMNTGSSNTMYAAKYDTNTNTWEQWNGGWVEQATVLVRLKQNCLLFSFKDVNRIL